MAEHRGLRVTGRPRRVPEQGHVGGASALEQFLVAMPLPIVERTAVRGNDREPDDHRVAIVLQTAHIVHDDPFEPREGIADAQHLVRLFLVLGEDFEVA
jgi:hypothetical protein